MSGGTPVGGGLMRQRYSQGYSSSGDDLEDDACSKPSSLLNYPISRARTWIEVIMNVLWIASAFFIIYLGDRCSNLIYLLWWDYRIRRTPLHLGMVVVVLNVCFVFYTNIAWGVRKSDENWEVLNPSAAPLVTVLGFFSFCLFSFALWPIWSFFTLPLLVTLLIACLVISPYLMIKTQSTTEELRTN